MTGTPADAMLDMARLAGEMVQTVVAQDARMLQLMQAEMDALGRLVLAPAVMSGATVPVAAATEAEIEAGFDNMPV